MPSLVNSSDFVRSEIDRVKKSEMSGFGNKNVRFFAHFVTILHSKVGLTLVNHNIGRLKSTLPASVCFKNLDESLSKNIFTSF